MGGERRKGQGREVRGRSRNIGLLQDFERNR